MQVIPNFCVRMPRLLALERRCSFDCCEAVATATRCPASASCRGLNNERTGNVLMCSVPAMGTRPHGAKQTLEASAGARPAQQAPAHRLHAKVCSRSESSI